MDDWIIRGDEVQKKITRIPADTVHLGENEDQK
jgi:hypothetical protein